MCHFMTAQCVCVPCLLYCCVTLTHTMCMLHFNVLVHLLQTDGDGDLCQLSGLKEPDQFSIYEIQYEHIERTLLF